MNKQVDLIWLGGSDNTPVWLLGDVWPTEPTPSAVHDRTEHRLQMSKAHAYLFWDSALGIPDPKRVQEVLARPGDLWHAGLRLGMGGLPGLIDFITPTRMLNCDPDPTIEATSWRLTLRACLMRTGVLRQLGGVRAGFQTLEGAALEMGHRYASHGGMTRHIPWLVPEDTSIVPPVLHFEDELRFVYYRFGRVWGQWALLRALASGYVSFEKAFKAWRSLRHQVSPSKPTNYLHDDLNSTTDSLAARVSVLIPTLERQSFLRTLLSQLRQQTVRPLEIIVVDQTPLERRDTTLAEKFSDLPLKIIYLDQPGQCSSRNVGLHIASGDYILFLDDDDEISPTLIEDHLRNLDRFRADVSSGVAEEVGAGPLPEAFTYTRVSDVFPTNNTLICKNRLQRSGLFDLAYDRGQRADGDLGMRIYLSGALMVLNHEISVLHHHASSGGLRAHKARVITYASSRNTLMQRHLPSATEIYLAMRYFTPRQLREALWLRAFGTFSIRGSIIKKTSKFIIGLLCLPSTLWEIHKRSQQARQMLNEFPRIPTMTDSEIENGPNYSPVVRLAPRVAVNLAPPSR